MDLAQSPHLIQGLNTGSSQPVVNPSSRHFVTRSLTRKKSLGFLSALLLGSWLKQLSSHKLRHRVSVGNLSSLLTACEHAAYETVDNEDEVTSQTGLLWDQSDGLYSYLTFTNHFTIQMHSIQGSGAFVLKYLRILCASLKMTCLWLSEYCDNKELIRLILYEVLEFYLLTLST